MILIVCILVFLLVAMCALTLLFRAGFSGTVSFIKAKSRESKAKILNRRKQDMLRASGPYTNYFILFGLEGNDRIELPVSKRLYKKAQIGKTGILTYKGSYFIDFVFDEDIKKEPKKEAYILNGEIVEKDY